MNTIILSGMAWAASLRDAMVQWIADQRGQDMLEYAILAGGLGIALALVFFAAPIDFVAWRNRIDCYLFFSGGC